MGMNHGGCPAFLPLLIPICDYADLPPPFKNDGGRLGQRAKGLKSRPIQCKNRIGQL